MLEFLRSWRPERGRVILFSGVFDPIHKGHLSVARSALEHAGGLVILLPERKPYRTLKTDLKRRTKTECSPYVQRLAMLKIAVGKQPDFLVLESPYDHHTIKETLSWMKEQFPKGQNFGLVFGADVAEHFWDWPNVESLHEFGVDLVLFANRKSTGGTLNIEQYIRPITGVKIEILDAENSNISSTQVRQDFKNKLSSLPEGVYDYILENNLYESDDSSAEK